MRLEDYFAVTSTWRLRAIGVIRCQGQTLHAINHLPYPERLYIKVCGLIFKESAQGRSKRIMADLPRPQPGITGGATNFGHPDWSRFNIRVLYPPKSNVDEVSGRKNVNALARDLQVAERLDHRRAGS